MPARPSGYAPGMGSDNPAADEPLDLDDQVGARAEPLPEEVGAGDDGDREAEAAAILRDSEDRVADATAGDAPGDAAQEHRRSDETVS